MAEVSFSIQMGENLKEQFEQVCSDLGMSVSMAITIFARMVVRERKIPFEIAASLASTTREDGLNAFLALREEAHSNGLQDMTLDDVNTEIQQTRAESKVYKQTYSATFNLILGIIEGRSGRSAFLYGGKT